MTDSSILSNFDYFDFDWTSIFEFQINIFGFIKV